MAHNNYKLSVFSKRFVKKPMLSEFREIKL